MRRAVWRMAAFGTGQHTISAIVGAMAQRGPLDVDTLRKHFRHELDMGMQEAIFLVASALYTSAVNGNVTAQIFFLKTRAGWRETGRLEVTGREGQPLPAQQSAVEASNQKILEAAFRKVQAGY
jgi:hypothetical protein